MSTAETTRIEQVVFDSLKTFGADETAIARDATFETLDVDSLDLVELSQIVKEEYGVEIAGDDLPKLRTVRDAVELVAARL